MGQRKKLNQFYKEEEKKKILNPIGMDTYHKLQNFYKLHPYSTPDVKEEVDKIRDECEAFSKALQEQFEEKHAYLLAEYLKKELDYVESYLSPSDKEKDEDKLLATSTLDPNERYEGPSVPPMKKKHWFKRVISYISI